MHIAFTGTQSGMTSRQLQTFISRFASTMMSIDVFHHGDCVGADSQAHKAVFEYSDAKIVIHPPEYDKKRAFCHLLPHSMARISLEPEEPYLVRNHIMVDRCEMLVATPAQSVEVLRSGTWATIRYARSSKKVLRIITPDGDVISEF